MCVCVCGRGGGGGEGGGDIQLLTLKHSIDHEIDVASFTGLSPISRAGMINRLINRL